MKSTTIKHQIRVNGVIADALYASKDVALGRVEIARNTGLDAEYAGEVEVDVSKHIGRTF